VILRRRALRQEDNLATAAAGGHVRENLITIRRRQQLLSE
jgi:hypothetical protein